MFTVCALYQFVRLDNFEEFRTPLRQLLVDLNIKGTLLLALEGLNGTVSGTQESINKLVQFLEEDGRFNNLEIKFSQSESLPFKRLKVKLKKEIVTLGVEHIDPLSSVGTYVKPKDWNALISDPDVILIDTRNDYEYGIGSFKGAINPNTETFREFPSYTKENLEQYRHKKVAMFCTGGIRCEKSTAYLKSQGFKEVYHLHGGVLKYLEEVEESDSLWEGECFVFDERVAVKHNLEQGQYDQCHACRYPITDIDKQHEHYVKGVSCPRCHGTHSEKQINRYQERQKQIELAKARGEEHIGDNAAQVIMAKAKKKAKKAQQS
ncbi:oxygen-dependent tRNA uridine(34) hydroxylase TrhO [Bathymodiolus septemdierum thioautotrophic gill symbiont]|uniref:tRNA uridine(34) hydroxylase n=1 Tax=endosymbiont of Bathymodiolus septemdierum str. Myojin knoll TaxID=1303921 RepID=A0A0P0US45_9GAMM|nr:rhodanese-related sulfurtransferase [Bathymodiolus septemdierum thioautotrophic gill symbiont]BAS67988.1 rhodanese domain protein [endosymbiont of Bathymodiolus septemdierum str. Myojin knoll]